MATQVFRPMDHFTPKREVEMAPEAASQTFKKGAPCLFVAGLVTECSASPTTADCIALADATGTTNASLPIKRILPGDQIAVPLVRDATLATVGATWVQGLVNTDVGLVKLTSGYFSSYWAATVSGSTNTAMIATIQKSLHPTGDVAPRVVIALKDGSYGMI